MSMSESYYSTLSTMLKVVIDEYEEQLEESDVRDLRTYVENREFGVCWELLNFVVESQGLEKKEKLIQSGELMELL